MGKITLLALMIHGEAGNQHLKGQIAVANVAMNRLADPRWPDSLEDVLLQPNQFSCFDGGVPDIVVADRFHVIAEQAINDWLVDVTDGATHYYAEYIDPPYWVKSCEFKCKIGAHLFYSET